MSEQQCTNPDGYHKLVWNLDHQSFHRIQKAVAFYEAVNNCERSTAIMALLDDAARYRVLVKELERKTQKVLSDISEVFSD